MVQSALKPVSKSRPCPVCGGDHKCSTAADGLICCGRNDGPAPGFRHLGPAKDPTWNLYRTESSVVHCQSSIARKASPAPARPTMDFGQLTMDHQRHLAENPARLVELAGRLGLPKECLARLDIGWEPGLAAWTFPEVNGLGTVVGIAVRYPDGTKRAIPGSRRGLTRVGGWADEPGPIFVVEGPSDVLAATAVGLTAIGRPSARGGVDDLALLLHDHRPGRPIVVVGENDRKPDGLWPGRDAARAVAEELARRIKRPVSWTMPPDDYKDVREWVSDRISGLAEGYDLPAIGRDIARELTAVAEAVQVAASVARPRRSPIPVPVTELQPPGPNGIAWVWDGFLARDSVTLLSALPKCGKTTLLSHLLAALPGGGEFCGRALAPGRAVVISEEPEGVWAVRAKSLGMTAAIRVLARGSLVRGNADDWAGFLADIAEHVAADPADLIVFDTLANLWPVKDENSAAEVGAALAPLHRLTAGRAVLLVHHLRKSDGQEGTGSRGSGALAGFVDVIAELRRVKAGYGDPNGRRRVLTGYGRYDAIPSEWIVEWDAETNQFHHRGEKEPSGVDATREAVLAMLADGKPWTRKELWDGLPDGLRKNEPRFKSVLEAEAGVLWRKEKGSGQGGGFVYTHRGLGEVGSC